MTDENHYKIESAMVEDYGKENELVCPLEMNTSMQNPGGEAPQIANRREKGGFSLPATTDREDEVEAEKRSCDEAEVVDQIMTISNETFTVAKSEFKVDELSNEDLEFPTKITICPVDEPKDDDDVKRDPIVTPRSIKASGSTDIEKIGVKAQEPPQLLARRLSRTETVRQDAMRLKSATLGRMGKMFRLRPPTPSGEPTTVMTTMTTTVTEVLSSDQYDEQPSRKEKTNSLGRMLKLVDKDGAPKKLSIPHPRTGSLTRIFRKGLSSGRDDNVLTCKPEDRSRGIFSRMLNQLRGRTGGGNLTAEPNLRLDPTSRPRPNVDHLPPAKTPITSRIISSDSSSAKAKAASSCSSAPTSAATPEFE